MWMGTDMALGDYVKERRKSLRWSQEYLAERAGMSRGYVGIIENNKNPKNGEPPNVSVEMIRGLVRALRSGGASASETEAFLAAGKTILDPSKDEEDYSMPQAQKEGHLSPNITIDDLPPGRTIQVQEDDPMAKFTGAGKVLLVDPKNIPYRQQIRRPCIVEIRGERQILRFMGEFDESGRNVYKFKNNGDEFTVPVEEASIKGILYLRIDFTELG